MKDQSSRPSGLGMTFLVLGVLGIVAAALFMVFAPCVRCPVCADRRRTGVNPMKEYCSYCENRGKVTLPKRWTHLENAPSR